MSFTMDAATAAKLKSTMSAFCVAAIFVGAIAAPDVAFAQGFEETDEKVTGFLDNIRGLLNIASAVVVTIAIIFAGYQIAFAHKRISDVAPILIGGFLIGAAAQIANMVIGDGDEAAAGPAAMIVVEAPPARHA